MFFFNFVSKIAIISYPGILAGNGLNVDERLKAARERREEHQKLIGMWAPT